ncbi:MAG: sigma-70 family RNA polymerase sigma factor [Planctomycetaceae bacterium]|nr:sigma-70 family RNA polymerase sigma factor [Planctomycetaceae bacterium]
MNKTDQELISESVSGQTQAFDTLMLRYQDRLYNALAQILRNREDARDAVQEAFVMAWKKLETFRGEAGFYSWLFRVAYNVAMSRERKKKLATTSIDHQSATSSFTPEDPHQDIQPSHRMETRERQLMVRTALENLPEEYRTVLVLKEIENFKYEQIAEIVDVPLGTVRSRIHRARGLLRDNLLKLLPEGEVIGRT